MKPLITPEDLATGGYKNKIVDGKIPLSRSLKDPIGIFPSNFGRPDGDIIGDIDQYKNVDLNLAFRGGERALQEGRALRQTTGELLLKGTGNIIEEVITGIAKAPGVLTMSVPGLILGKEGLIDNYYLQAVDFINDNTLGKWTEVFTPPSLQEGSLTEQIFNPYFAAGTGSDAAGMMLGLLIPGRWVAGLGGGVKIASKLAKLGKLGDVAADGSKLLGQNPNAFGKFLVKTLGSTGRGIDFGKLANNIDSGLSVATNTLLEAGAEAIDTYDTLIQQGVDPEEATNKARNIFLMNTALLAATNSVLEKYLFDGFNRLPETKRLVSQALKGEKIAYQPIKQGLSKLATGIVSEGFIEEGLQTSMQQAVTEDLGSSIASTLNRYYDNLGSLFSDNPDIEFGQSVFLGSLLGGVVGSAVGVKDVYKQKALLEGRPEVKEVGIFGKMLGKQARKAQEGLISIYKSSFEKLKQGKDFLKENKSADLLAEETALFAVSNMFEDLVESTNGDITQALGFLSNSLINEIGLSQSESKSLIDKLIPEQLKVLSKSEALEFIKNRRDISYFSRFASNPAGFEILDSHIDDMTDALSERYEMNTGIKLSEERKKKIVSELKQKAKLYEDINTAAQKFNSNIRYNIEVSKENKAKFDHFVMLNNNIAEETMHLKSFLEESIKRVTDETKPVTDKINQLVNTRESLLADTSKTKDELAEIRKEYNNKIKEAEKSIFEYKEKIKDLKIYNDALTDIDEKIIEHSTKEGIKAKWDALMKIEDEAKKAGEFTINGRVIDFTNKAEVNIILFEEFKKHGYDVSLDPNTGSFKINGTKFYFKYDGSIYTVTRTVKNGKGVFKIDKYGTDLTGISDGWEALFKRFKKIDILSEADAAVEKTIIDKQLIKEKEDLEKEARIKALELKESEFRRSYKSSLEKIEALNKRIGLYKDKIEELKNRISGETLTPEETNEINLAIKDIEVSINMLENVIATLNDTARLALVKADALKKVISEMKSNVAKYNTETLNQKLSKTTEPGVKDIVESALDKSFKNANEAILKLEEIAVAASKLADSTKEIINNLKRMHSFLQKFVADNTLGDALLKVKGVISDELNTKYPNLKSTLEKLAAETNENKIYKLLSDFISQYKDHSDYYNIINTLVKDLQPYISFSEKGLEKIFLSESTKKESENAISEYNTKKEKADQIRWFSRYILLNSLSKELYKLKRRVLREWTKDEGEQQQNDELDTFIESDETDFKPIDVFTTTGVNFNHIDNKTQYVYDSELDINVPEVNETNGTFFKWADQADNEKYNVIPYAPKYTEEDFEDITDSDTAKLLREKIAGTPSDKREDALYAVVLDANNKVRIYEGQPVITSIMTPGYKYPEGSPSKVAGRANVSYFLNTILKSGFSLLSSADYNNAKIDDDIIEELVAYGGFTEDELKGKKYSYLEPFARTFARKMYTKGVNNKLELARKKYGSIEERVNATKLQQSSNKISKGFLTTVKDATDANIKFNPISALGLKFDSTDNTPANFNIITANKKGEATGTVKTHRDLKPGNVYIELTESGKLVPLETRTLNNSEIETVLFLISQFADGSRDLSKKLDLPGYVIYNNVGKVELKDIDIIPTNKARNGSLMNFLISWGLDKEGTSPFSIYISKGNVVFGEMSIPLKEVQEAFIKDDFSKIGDLISFLSNKRLNISDKLLRRTSRYFPRLKVTRHSDGRIELESKNYNDNYTKWILENSVSVAIPERIRSKHNLPIHNQRHLMFQDFNANVSETATDIKPEIIRTFEQIKKDTRAAYEAKKEKSTPASTPTSTPNTTSNESNAKVSKSLNMAKTLFDVIDNIKEFEHIYNVVLTQSKSGFTNEFNDIIDNIRKLLASNSVEEVINNYAKEALERYLNPENKNESVNVEQKIKEIEALIKVGKIYANAVSQSMTVEEEQKFALFHDSFLNSNNPEIQSFAKEFENLTNDNLSEYVRNLLNKLSELNKLKSELQDKLNTEPESKTLRFLPFKDAVQKMVDTSVLMGIEEFSEIASIEDAYLLNRHLLSKEQILRITELTNKYIAVSPISKDPDNVFDNVFIKAMVIPLTVSDLKNALDEIKKAFNESYVKTDKSEDSIHIRNLIEFDIETISNLINSLKPESETSTEPEIPEETEQDSLTLTDKSVVGIGDGFVNKKNVVFTITKITNKNVYLEKNDGVNIEEKVYTHGNFKAMVTTTSLVKQTKSTTIKPATPTSTTNINVGDTVLYNGEKHKVLDINGNTLELSGGTEVLADNVTVISEPAKRGKRTNRKDGSSLIRSSESILQAAIDRGIVKTINCQ